MVRLPLPTASPLILLPLQTLPTKKKRPSLLRKTTFLISGSPGRSKGRTFRIVFRLQPAVRHSTTFRRTPRKVYRNPVILAQEWRRALESGEVCSRAELARTLGLSRARITQVLGLLRLSPKVLREIKALGDPLDYLIMTERQLRPVVRCAFRDQERLIKELLSKTRHFGFS